MKNSLVRNFMNNGEPLFASKMDQLINGTHPALLDRLKYIDRVARAAPGQPFAKAEEIQDIAVEGENEQREGGDVITGEAKN